MSRRLIGLMLLASLSASAQARPPLELVDEVDLERFQGRWYEIALLPNFFQRRCVAGTNANYALRPDGLIQVVNRCQQHDGRWLGITGAARPASDHVNNNALEVRFAPRWLAALPFVWGDFRVMALGADYDYALVGARNRRYLWILARSPELDEETFDRLRRNAAEQGFPVERLVMTEHQPDA